MKSLKIASAWLIGCLALAGSSLPGYDTETEDTQNNCCGNPLCALFPSEEIALHHVGLVRSGPRHLRRLRGGGGLSGFASYVSATFDRVDGAPQEFTNLGWCFNTPTLKNVNGGSGSGRPVRPPPDGPRFSGFSVT
jgi:hypothetical protein